MTTTFNNAREDPVTQEVVWDVGMVGFAGRLECSETTVQCAVYSVYIHVHVYTYTCTCTHVKIQTFLGLFWFCGSLCKSIGNELATR